MESYFENVILLTHNQTSKLLEAVERYKSQELLSYFFPEPDDLPKFREIDELAVSARLTDEIHESNEVLKAWRHTNWWTSHDIFQTTKPIWIDPNTVRLSFNTFLNPPLPAYDEAVKRHGFYITACDTKFDLDGTSCGIYEPSITNMTFDEKDAYNIERWLEIFGMNAHNRILDEGYPPEVLQPVAAVANIETNTQGCKALSNDASGQKQVGLHERSLETRFAALVDELAHKLTPVQIAYLVDRI